MRIEGILREITKNHPGKHADKCVCTHYLLFIYPSYAESRVFTVKLDIAYQGLMTDGSLYSSTGGGKIRKQYDFMLQIFRTFITYSDRIF